MSVIEAGYGFLYEIDEDKIKRNKQYIVDLLEKITLREFNKFHNRHKYRLFRMYRYVK